VSSPPDFSPEEGLGNYSDRGGQRAAFFNSLIVTAKLNDIDPQAWLADVLARIANYPAGKLHDLLPWNWKPNPPIAEAA
jgi:transposase